MSFPIQQEPVGRLRNRSTAARQRRPRPVTHPRPVKPEVLAVLIDGITERRDRAIILMLIDSGLRASELVKLNREMISLDTTAPGGRGLLPPSLSLRTRTFWVTARTVDALRDYLSTERDQDCNAALFVDQRGNRITAQQLRKMIHRWCDQLGVERVNVHQFRHSLVLRLLERGCSLSTVGEIMGYSHYVSGLKVLLRVPLQKHPLDTE